MPDGGRKVVVAMSGGVDSSVAAALLLRAGYEVIGAFMRLGMPEGVQDAELNSCDCPGQPAGHKQGCCSVLDAADARRVAAALGIPLYVLNFQADFNRVIDEFVAEYNRGRTPNPCVRCNQWLKFGKLMAYADAAGAHYVASGHYARIGRDDAGRASLLRGVDHRKDQSYVLFGLPRQSLDRLLLPIGELDKPRVRAIAEELKLPVFNKPDSQEICFVPDHDYAGLVKRRTPEAVREGDIVDEAGRVIGRHEGHQHYTIGQRKGLRVAVGHPVYVTQIDPATNRVTLGGRQSLLRSGLGAREVNMLRPDWPGGRCHAKIRYNHAPQPASAALSGPNELTVRFDEPQPAVTPGQAVVLYDGETVIGGGWIDRAMP